MKKVFFPDREGRGGKRGVGRRKEKKQKYLDMKHPGIFISLANISLCLDKVDFE